MVFALQNEDASSKRGAIPSTASCHVSAVFTGDYARPARQLARTTIVPGTHDSPIGIIATSTREPRGKKC